MKLNYLLSVVLLLFITSCEYQISHDKNEFITNEVEQCSNEVLGNNVVCLKYPAFSKQLLSIIASEQKDSFLIKKLTVDLEPGTIKELNIILNKYCHELANDLEITDEFANEPKSTNTMNYYTFKIRK